MLLTALYVSMCSLFGSFFIQKIVIQAAYRFKLLDHPSPRRRHRAPTPIIGGLGIFFTWALGLALFCLIEPNWFEVHAKSLLPIVTSLSILLVLGVIDDVKGLTPKPKFFFQALAAFVVIVYEPNLHYLCLAWKSVLGDFVWPMMGIWIVGITNAVNLIDGLDGLAGGTAFLVCTSIGILSFMTGGDGFQGVCMMILASTILGFLKFNWNPAKIFLGDNGSLPLGFMIAISSLTCRPPTHSWVVVASVILMLGYPILDMGLAVLRRYRSGLPLFKADRNHLHFRIQRLGLSVKQTSAFLLSISVYLQITALSLHLLPVEVVPIALAMVLFSIFGILFVVRGIEHSRVERLAGFRRNEDRDALDLVIENSFLIQIQLGPIFEVGLYEEKTRYRDLVRSLEMMLRATAAKNEEITLNQTHIQILLRSNGENSGENVKNIRLRYQDKLEKFCSMVDLQPSMSTIPIRVKKSA